MTLFQRILVPLDGSQRAELILPHLTQLRKREASELLLVHSISANSPENGGYDSAPTVVRQRQEAQSYLEGVARRYEVAGGNIRTCVVEGPPSGAILDAVEREGSTMIAMTTHGRTGLLRWLMGSVADQVILASRVPMFLIRPLLPPDPPPVEPAILKEPLFRNILIATDGSIASMAIVDPARQLATLFGSKIVVLHVWDSFVLDGAPLLGMEVGMSPPHMAPLSSEDEVTARVARQFASSGLKVTRVTRYGEAASEILNYTCEYPVDLIALAIRDHWELLRWLRGSVSERLLRSAFVPLLIVRTEKIPALQTPGP